MKRLTPLALLVALVALNACGGTRIQREDPKRDVLVDADFNDADRRQIVDQAVQSLLRNPVVTEAAKRPVILTGEKFIQNRTTEHISRKAVLDMMVSSLTETGKIDIVDLDARKDMHDEFQYHAMGYIDPATIKGPGKELGADYILSGRIISEIHKSDDVKVIHYQTTLQLIDISTNVIRWSVTTEIKKSQVK